MSKTFPTCLKANTFFPGLAEDIKPSAELATQDFAQGFFVHDSVRGTSVRAVRDDTDVPTRATTEVVAAAAMTAQLEPSFRLLESHGENAHAAFSKDPSLLFFTTLPQGTALMRCPRGRCSWHRAPPADTK